MEVEASQDNPPHFNKAALGNFSSPAKDLDKHLVPDDLKSGQTSTADTLKLEEAKEKSEEVDIFHLPEQEDLVSEHAPEEEEEEYEEDKNFSDLPNSVDGLNSSGFNSDYEDQPKAKKEDIMIIGALKQDNAVNLFVA